MFDCLPTGGGICLSHDEVKRALGLFHGFVSAIASAPCSFLSLNNEYLKNRKMTKKMPPISLRAGPAASYSKDLLRSSPLYRWAPSRSRLSPPCCSLFTFHTFTWRSLSASPSPTWTILPLLSRRRHTGATSNSYNDTML